MRSLTKHLVLATAIAAFFAEPVQGAGGVIVPPAGHLKQLRELCRRHDILFVADEVITGFGRLGAWFASDLWDLEPDLITMAKGITSGYVPLGATMASDAIADALSKAGYLAHGFTYSGHPVATAAALANLTILENEKLIERTRDVTGPHFQRRLRALASHPAAGEVRPYPGYRRALASIGHLLVGTQLANDPRHLQAPLAFRDAASVLGAAYDAFADS